METDLQLASPQPILENPFWCCLRGPRYSVTASLCLPLLIASPASSLCAPAMSLLGILAGALCCTTNPASDRGSGQSEVIASLLQHLSKRGRDLSLDSPLHSQGQAPFDHKLEMQVY